MKLTETEKHAFKKANLWKNGKMIGGNSLEVLSILSSFLSREDGYIDFTYEEEDIVYDMIEVLHDKIEQKKKLYR